MCVTSLQTKLANFVLIDELKLTYERVQLKSFFYAR
jgi:hypothetical protein